MYVQLQTDQVKSMQKQHACVYAVLTVEQHITLCES